MPCSLTENAETVPLPAPPWALLTNSCEGSVGRNSEPNGPGPCAVNGDPGAAVRRPPQPMWKLAICELLTSGTTSRRPVGSTTTSSGPEPDGSATVECAS